MKFPLFATAAIALALTACGQQKFAENESNAPVAVEQTQEAKTYSGTGKVAAIEGDHVSIAHGPIEGIGWPAMTMFFTAPVGMATSVGVGSDVSFAFRQDGGSYVLTSLERR